jgi:Flp pilus assembly protein TadD
MMQTYGFCRIYDAKIGSFAAFTRRLDFAVCAIWFATAVLLSSPRMTDTLETYYASGGPFIPVWLLHGVQQGMLLVAIAVSVLFLFNFARMWVLGKRPNPVKLALLVTSISFWWYCNNGVANILAGIALFEVFHDVQYLSLVWIYNRNRVEKDSSIGGFMRFVFRRSGSLIGLYVGLVFAYGSLAYFNSRLEVETIKRVLTGVVAASGLLHFYYDGFIWKVRDRSTRESLGLTGGVTAGAADDFLPNWLLHGLKWVAVFVIPLTALWIGQTRGVRAPDTEQKSWVVADLPVGAMQRFDYAASLARARRLDEAAEQYRLGLSFAPNDETAHNKLGNLLFDQAKMKEAASQFEEASRLAPRNGDLHSDFGKALERLGRRDYALAEFQTGIRLSPRSGLVHYNYAMFLAADGKLDEAIAEFQTALRHKPKHPEGHYHLGRALFLKGDLEGAKRQYLETARLDPYAPVHNGLGVIHMRLGQTLQAIKEFKEALRLRPEDAEAAENLRFAIANQTRLDGGSPPPR